MMLGNQHCMVRIPSHDMNSHQTKKGFWYKYAKSCDDEYLSLVRRDLTFTSYIHKYKLYARFVTDMYTSSNMIEIRNKLVSCKQWKKKWQELFILIIEQLLRIVIINCYVYCPTWVKTYSKNIFYTFCYSLRQNEWCKSRDMTSESNVH